MNLQPEIQNQPKSRHGTTAQTKREERDYWQRDPGGKNFLSISGELDKKRRLSREMIVMMMVREAKEKGIGGIIVF